MSTTQLLKINFKNVELINEFIEKLTHKLLTFTVMGSAIVFEYGSSHHAEVTHLFVSLGGYTCEVTDYDLRQISIKPKS